MTMIRFAFAMVLALAVTGCSAISSLNDASTTLEAYELRAAVDLPIVQGNLRRDLVIEEPTSGGALATDRIMIRPGPFEAQYLPGVRWTDTAPVMLQSLMLRAFEDSNGLRYVGRRPLGGIGDVVLVSELTDFQAEVAPDGVGLVTRVRMTVRLVREEDAQILGSRTIQTSAQAASDETLDVVEAMNRATASALDELLRWAFPLMGGRVVP